MPTYGGPITEYQWLSTFMTSELRKSGYHGLRRKHLQAYLDEFVFRFNRRKTRHAAFRSLFRLATNAEPLTYSMLIEPEPCA